MHMQPVASSDLSSVGYDAQTGTLYISFHSGSTYAYDHVPSIVYNGLMSAPSRGKYFHAYIKGRYSYRRIG